jgi:PAS domain S-box-containing protein
MLNGMNCESGELVGNEGSAQFLGNSPMAARISRMDWRNSPLGPPEDWPSELLNALRLILAAESPYFVAWGPDLICFWNGAYEPIFGDRDVLPGRRFQDMWPEAWSIVGPLALAALNGKPSFFEDLPIKIRRNGALVQTWWTFGYSPIQRVNGDPGGMLGTLIETTSRVLLEREVKERQAALETFRNVIPDLLWEADGSGRMRYMNHTMRDYLGLDLSAASEWTNYVHPDDIPVIVQKFALAQERQKMFESHHRMRNQDGTYRWFMAKANPAVASDGTISGWYGCASDTHELRSVLDQLGQSREMLQQFAESAAQLIWIAQIDSGRVEFVNRRAHRFWRRHIAAEGPISWSMCRPFVHAEDQSVVRDGALGLKAGEAFRAQVRLVGSNGAQQVQVTAFPIREADGRILKYGALADVAEPAASRCVYLVDPDTDSHRRLSSLLWAHGFEVKGFADTVAFGQVASSLLPGCLLLHAHGSTSWLKSAAAVAGKTDGRLQTVVASACGGDIDHVKEMMRLGVRDVLLASEDSWDALHAAINEAIAHVHDLPFDTPPLSSGNGHMDRLSPREREVLDLLVTGATTKVIARQLGISPRTVEAHRSHILERLGVGSMAEAIAAAVVTKAVSSS